MSTSIQQYLRDPKRGVAIISVFPLPLYAERRHNGYTRYHIPAAPHDGYAKVESHSRTTDDKPFVTNGVVLGAIDYGVDRTTDPDTPIERPIPVDVIADDLVRAWSTSQLAADGTMGPGVGTIASEEPTDAELSALRARQSAYFQKLVFDADGMWARGDVRSILPLHRAAARWLGVENRDWVKEISHTPMKSCLACDERIKATALKCQHCGTDLIEWAKVHGVTEDVDPFVFRRARGERPAAFKKSD